MLAQANPASSIYFEATFKHNVGSTSVQRLFRENGTFTPGMKVMRSGVWVLDESSVTARTTILSEEASLGGCDYPLRQIKWPKKSQEGVAIASRRMSGEKDKSFLSDKVSKEPVGVCVAPSVALLLPWHPVLRS